MDLGCSGARERMTNVSCDMVVVNDDTRPSHLVFIVVVVATASLQCFICNRAIHGTPHESPPIRLPLYSVSILYHLRDISSFSSVFQMRSFATRVSHVACPLSWFGYWLLTYCFTIRYDMLV